jgi:hypothetical protein
MELQESLCLLRRRTALHDASQNGHTETAMALVKAGADMRCKDSDGYCLTLGAASSCRCVPRSAGAAGPSTRLGAAGVAGLAVQVDGAALGVAERPHGDGNGAG